MTNIHPILLTQTGTAPTTGQVLTATSATTAGWLPAAGGSPTGIAGGDLGGTYPNPTVVSAVGNFSVGGISSLDGGAILTNGLGSISIAGNISFVEGITALNILTTTSTTSGLATFSGGISTNDISTNQLVVINGATPGFVLTSDSFGDATWQAAPNPFPGVTITGTPSAGSVLLFAGTSDAVYQSVFDVVYDSVSGEVVYDPVSGQIVLDLESTPALINGVVISGTPSVSGEVLVSTGPNSATWEVLGGSGGTPTGAAGGDLTGTYPDPQVTGANANFSVRGDMFISPTGLYHVGSVSISEQLIGPTPFLNLSENAPNGGMFFNTQGGGVNINDVLALTTNPTPNGGDQDCFISLSISSGNRWNLISKSANGSLEFANFPAGTTPFHIDAGAPSGSFFINSSGNANFIGPGGGLVTVNALTVLTGATSGYVLTSDSFGNATWQAGGGGGGGGFVPGTPNLIAADTNYTISPTDKWVIMQPVTINLTATMPAAASVAVGYAILVSSINHPGFPTGVNTNVVPSGSDTINGTTASTPALFYSDGVANWFNA